MFTGTWSAVSFFSRLAAKNKLARQHNFIIAEVSGLQGFLDAISQAQTYPNVIAIDDTSDGYSDIANSPHSRMIKTIYTAMRHTPGDQRARRECLAIMHEIFRQFMSVIIREKTRLEEDMIYLDSRISFSEMDRYFCTGQACAFFQLTIDTDTDLVYNPDEWIS
jgi:hypothetical protein